MSSSVSWLPNSTNVIVAAFNTNPGPKEFIEQFDTIKAMLDTVNHPVYVCHDLTCATRIGKIDIRESRLAVCHPVITHPNRAFSYFIGASRSAEVVINLVQKLFPTSVQRLMLVETLDEALQDIRQRSANTSDVSS